MCPRLLSFCLFGMALRSSLAVSVEMPKPSSEGCSAQSGHGCWEFHNASTAPMRVSCRGAQGTTWIEETEVGVAKHVVKQLDRTAGDGLGFPAPQQEFTCDFSRAGGAAASYALKLKSLGWGDNVTFTMGKSAITAVQSESWGTGERKISQISVQPGS